MQTAPTVVGLGEILWDLLPSGRQLGGAPANFAYCSHLLGDRAIVASRVGSDELGKEACRHLLRAGMSDRFVQVDSVHPTGTVPVHLNSHGQPRFEVSYPAAWDFLEFDRDWSALAQTADAVCFGSLAQRSTSSRKAVREFLDAVRPEALRIFDVNLRQQFYSAEIVRESVQRAKIIKLNDEEVPKIAELLAVTAGGEIEFARSMIRKFGLELICITRGERGSLLASPNGTDEHPGFRARVSDTVGAGDAFTAGLVHERLRGGTLTSMNDLANRMGAWVASSPGAMPPAPTSGLRRTLEEWKGK